MSSSPARNPDLERYLTDEEKLRLVQLRNHAEQARTSVDQRYHPLHMTLAQLGTRWVTVHKEILHDLIAWVSSFEATYGVYFTDIDQTKQWIDGGMRILRDFAVICTKGDRGIYLGVTLIVLSIWIYLVYTQDVTTD